MPPKPKLGKTTTNHKLHLCPRHHDLSILLKSARKDICNTCFATLKKSYFNVIAGMLLEMHWLHDMTRRSVEQDNTLLQRLQEQEQAILNLQAEIVDVKNNGRNHETPRQETPQPTHPAEPPLESQHQASAAEEVYPEGHVSKAIRLLKNLTQSKIARILKNRKAPTNRNTPKRDDLKDGKGTTHTHGGFLML